MSHHCHYPQPVTCASSYSCPSSSYLCFVTYLPSSWGMPHLQSARVQVSSSLGPNCWPFALRGGVIPQECHHGGLGSLRCLSSVCGGPAGSVFSSDMQAFQGRWGWGMMQKILEPGAGSLHEDRRGAGHVEANPQAMSPVRGCFLSGTACTLSSDPGCHFLY